MDKFHDMYDGGHDHTRLYLLFVLFLVSMFYYTTMQTYHQMVHAYDIEGIESEVSFDIVSEHTVAALLGDEE